MITHYLFDGIYGEILGPLAAALDEAKAGDGRMKLVLNNYGGDTMVGWSAYNLIRGSGVQVTADVIGLCASAATFVLLACETRTMSSNASIMIHEAEAFAMGRSDAIALTAEQVARVNSQMVDLYASTTKLTTEDARAAMKATTYYTAEQALALGFVQSTYAAIDAAAQVLIAASLRRSPAFKAALAAVREPMTLDEILTAANALSAEDSAKLREALAPAPVVTTDESALGEAVATLAGVPAAAALGAVMAWKTSADAVSSVPEEKPDPMVEVEALFTKYADRATPALRETISAHVKAGTLTAAGAEAWLSNSRKVTGNANPKASAVNPAPRASGVSASVTYNGKTYAQLLAESPAMLARLKQEDPDTFNALRDAG